VEEQEEEMDQVMAEVTTVQQDNQEREYNMFEKVGLEEKEALHLQADQELLRVKMINDISVDKDINGKALGDYEIEMIGSTMSEDRDGEAIDIKAWDLKNFKKNPVILPQHDYRKPAIGKATSIKVKDGKLVFKIEFPEDGINPEADIYRKLYKSGFMNSSSVGFIPKTWVDGDGKKSPFRTFTKVELLELSLVSVPSNPTALMSAKSKGIVSDDELKSIGFDVEDVEEKSSDPNLLINDEHMVQHSQIMEFIGGVKDTFSAIDKRLTFIEGFIEGSKKSALLEETDETSTIEVDSYVKELLCGKPLVKSNDEVSTGKVNLKDVLTKKSLKDILKG